MLRLLLDEHISPRVAEQVRRAIPGAEIEAIQHWGDGRLFQQSDERILHEAEMEGWTLLTYDLATIPPLISELSDLGKDHGGSSSYRRNPSPRTTSVPW